MMALWISTLVFTACNSSSSSLLSTPEGPAQELYNRLKLKKGLKIILAQRIVDDNSADYGKSGLRTLTITAPSGAEGLTFEWGSNKPHKVPKKNLITPGSLSEPESSPAPDNQKPQMVVLYTGTSEGQMSLPNIIHARRMTLPSFWPKGDLYLSNSSGIWLSDTAFEELKRKRKTRWQAGLLNNPILGPVQNMMAIELGLEKLEKNIEESPRGLAKALEIKVQKKSGSYPVKINGDSQKVEIIQAGNTLSQFKILKNAQNPLILSVTVAPKASIPELLFSPLGLIKGLVEYRVVEIITPEKGTTILGGNN